MRPILVTLALLAVAASAVRKDLAGDPLPDGAAVRLGTVRLRQPWGVSCLALTPDGKHVVAGGGTNKMCFFDVATGKLAREWVVGTSHLISIHYSADGKTLAVSCGDGVVRVLDPETGDEKNTFTDPNRRYTPHNVALSPDGRILLHKDGNDRTLDVWNLETGKSLHRVTGVGGYYGPPIAFTPDSKHFVSTWTDGKLHLIDVETGASVRCLEPATVAPDTNAYSNRLSKVALTPDGKHLLYRLQAETVFRVVDVATGKELRQIDRSGASGFNSSSGGRAVVSPNGRFVFDCTDGGSILVWGLASGKLLREFTSPAGQVSHLCLSADGKLVAGAYGSVVLLWDVQTGKPLHAVGGHQSAPTRLLFSPDGKGLVSVGSSTLRRWDTASGREVEVQRNLGAHTMNYLSLSRDGTTLSWAGWDRSRHRLRLGEAAPTQVSPAVGHAGNYSVQEFCPTGRYLAAVDNNDRRLRLTDLQEKTPPRELLTFAEPHGHRLQFSPDGQLLVVTGQDRAVTFFDVPTGAELRKIVHDPTQQPDYGPAQVTFSPDGRALAVFDGDIRVAEAVTGSERIRFVRETQGAPAVLAMSEDNRLLGVGYADGLVIAYDTLTGRELFRRNTEQGTPQALAFSQDRRTLATAGANTTILLWDLPATPGLEPAAVSEDSLWEDLAAYDAAKGYRAMQRLLASPETAVRVVRERLKPAEAADAKRVARLVAELDHPKYAVRERAGELLEEVGPAAREALREAAGGTSLESRQRAAELLRRLERRQGVAPGRLRRGRAVEVLERVGTPAARAVLERLREQKPDPAFAAALEWARGRM